MAETHISNFIFFILFKTWTGLIITDDMKFGLEDLRVLFSLQKVMVTWIIVFLSLPGPGKDVKNCKRGAISQG